MGENEESAFIELQSNIQLTTVRGWARALQIDVQKKVHILVDYSFTDPLQLGKLNLDFVLGNA